jgi:hypothetical protein
MKASTLRKDAFINEQRGQVRADSSKSAALECLKPGSEGSGNRWMRIFLQAVHNGIVMESRRGYQLCLFGLSQFLQIYRNEAA